MTLLQTASRIGMGHPSRIPAHRRLLSIFGASPHHVNACFFAPTMSFLGKSLPRNNCTRYWQWTYACIYGIHVRLTRTYVAYNTLCWKLGISPNQSNYSRSESIQTATKQTVSGPPPQPRRGPKDDNKSSM